jgi:hypothetical protein
MQLLALELGWTKGADDDPTDQCVHGRVLFQIGATTFVRPEDDIWTVGAAGLFLLRTLEHDHTIESPVSEANVLIPCCGHAVYRNLRGRGRFEVLCMGCNQGKNPEVIHKDENVVIRADHDEEVSFAEWKTHVFEFVDQVQRFYRQCAPKAIPDDPDDRAGWAAFWTEWRTRREGQYS